MRISRLFVLLALILVAGCGRGTPTLPPTPEPIALPTLTPSPVEEATLLPPTDTPGPTPTISVVAVIDDFEAAQTGWQAGLESKYADSSALGVVLTTERASQGLQALQLNFAKNDKPKAIFYLTGQLDLSQARTLRFDLYTPGALDGVAVAFNTGPDQVWYESNTLPVSAGKWVTIVIDLTASNFKAASTNWEFRTPIVDLNNVQQLSIIIFPVKTSSVFLDNLYLSDTPPAP